MYINLIADEAWCYKIYTDFFNFTLSFNKYIIMCANYVYYKLYFYYKLLCPDFPSAGLPGNQSISLGLFSLIGSMDPG